MLSLGLEKRNIFCDYNIYGRINPMMRLWNTCQIVFFKRFVRGLKGDFVTKIPPFWYNQRLYAHVGDKFAPHLLSSPHTLDPKLL